MYTKKEAFEEINTIQDYYVSELINKINDEENSYLKEINFTSATGTGKTMMMCKLMEKMPDYHFVITTLSRGQLHLQVKDSVAKNCKSNNYQVYGLMDYRINSILTAEDILKVIPEDKKIIWLRDEGHIKTNRFDKLLANKCFKVINFSATNVRSDIKCNFTQTMMLRTVEQKCGSVEEAINKLLEIKKIHKDVTDYNPCAIFRVIKSDEEWIEEKCRKYKLKYINITNEDFDMSELCKDNNEYDVIINKLKVQEGVDIRRAHVLYMDSKPSNIATRIQAIGRCRRNALLYNDSVDIFAPENHELLKETRKCYVFYDDYEAKVDTDKNGELQMAFCNYITCEDIKPGSVITVENGVLPNGLIVYELLNNSGKFTVIRDEKLGFNRIEPANDFYKEIVKYRNYDYIYFSDYKMKRQDYIAMKALIKDKTWVSFNNYAEENVHIEISDDVKKYLKDSIEKIFVSERLQYISKLDLDNIPDDYVLIYDINNYINEYTKSPDSKKWLINIAKNANKQSLINRTFTKNEKSVYVYYLIKRNIVQKDEKECFEKFSALKSFYLEHTGIKINDVYKQLYKSLVMPCYKILTSDTIVLNDFSVTSLYNEKPKVTKEDIDYFLTYFDESIRFFSNVFISSASIIEVIQNHLNNICKAICNDLVPIVKWDYSEYFKDLQMPIDRNESFFAKNRRISNNDNFYSYYYMVNDLESAIIGTESFRSNYLNEWYEDATISKKVEYNSKLVRFIENKYFLELKEASEQLFTGSNTFNLNKRCNNVIGYCVEYYSKYLLYGKSFLSGILRNEKDPSEEEIINACMQKYKYYMMSTYGEGISTYVKAFSEEKLNEYKEFVKICIDLGKKTANFVKDAMYKDIKPVNNHNPNLSIKHLAGLADYISEDIILDVKVKNHISIRDAYQILAYHYLSTKRSDLKVDKLIIYDATSGKSVIIHITDTNKTSDINWHKIQSQK